MAVFTFDPPARNPRRRYTGRPRPCPACRAPMAVGHWVAVWGPLPYRRTRRRANGSARTGPPVAYAHDACIATATLGLPPRVRKDVAYR